MFDSVDRALSPVDYIIFVLTLLVSLAIGVVYAVRDRRSKTGTEGYLLAGRTMAAIPTGISLAASFQSSVAILGIPNDVYFYGITYVCSPISKVLAFIVVSHIFIPILHNLQIWSAYEYLDKRFTKSIRLLGTSFYLLTNVVHMGINIYGPALLLSGVTGVNIFPVMLSTGLICVIYTTLGGLRGVIWTDVFQGSIMLIGMLAIIIRGSIMQGGIDKVWEIGSAGGRTSINFSLDPRIRYTFWSSTIGGFVTWVGIFGTNQCQVQRMLSVKTQQEAKKALAVGLVGICLCGILAVLCGLVGYTFYHNCDPRLSGCVSRSDEIYPFAIFNIFHDTPGLSGLFMACVFSACFSTISSVLNSMVTVMMADFIKPHTQWSEKVYTWVAKVATLLCGCLGLAIGIAASVAGDIIRFGVGSVAAFMGPSLGVFLLGIWFPFVNSWGALCGFVAGFVSGFGMFIGATSLKRPQYLTGYLNFSTESCPDNCDFTMSSNISYSSIVQPTVPSSETELQGAENLFAVSVYYLSLITLTITLLIGIIVSLMTGGWRTRHKVDRKLMNPLFESKPLTWVAIKGRKCLTYCFSTKSKNVGSSEADTTIAEKEALKS